MKITNLKPRKALNKAFLKVKPNRSEIERFKAHLIQLLDRTNDTESEEFHKNLVIDFLKKTYYEPNHFINTKGRNDLVIHNGDKAKSTVGVIIEAKKPTNRSEMPHAFANTQINEQTGEQMDTAEKLNTKAFQELVEEILSIKNYNPTADTTAIESQIDQLVYQLYGLTEEEIQIIESKS